MEKLTLKAATETAGKVSRGNGKMPGSTFATDAFACNVGSRLANVKGSVCEKCYARRIQKLRPSVNKGWSTNYMKATALIANAPAKWIAAMVFQIEKALLKTSQPYHRWFDSGDLDSVDMLDCIKAVAEKTPEIKHWLPTRELSIVSKSKRPTPPNLVIRVSAPMVNDKPLSWPNTSTVHDKTTQPIGHVCPASQQGNACGDCRACWTPSVANVSYPKH